ncbi:COP9 signalosome complex subunit 2, partial [Aphelenchoides avenae]
MDENVEENGLSAQYRIARKARTEGNFEEASKKFTHIVEEDAGCSEWSLKALKQLIKIDQAKNDEAALLRHYKRFLNDCGMGMCTDELELSIRRILQRVIERHSLQCARSCLEKTVDYFKESGDDLRWFKFAVLLSKHYLRMAEHVLFFPLVRELKDAVKSGKDSEKKAAMSVDMAVLELGYSTDHVPDAQLARSWYEKAKDGAMTVRPMNPCTTAVIAEREGHATFDEGRYWASQHNFFGAFKLLDGIRSEDTLRLLKLAMIARTLTTEEEAELPEEATRRLGDHEEIVQTRELLRIWDTRPFHEFQVAVDSAQFALVWRGIDDFLQKFIEFGRRKL